MFSPTGFVAETTPIEVLFSEAVDSGYARGILPVTQVALIDPPLKAEAEFVEPTRLVIRPKEPFRPATRYRVALRPDVLGTKTLVGSRVFRFGRAPFSLGSTRAWRLGQNVELALRFSDAVDARHLAAALTLRTEEGTPVSLPEASLGADRLVRFVLPTPSNVLELVVDGGLGSVDGEARLGKIVRRVVPVAAFPPVVDDVVPYQLGVRLGLLVRLYSSVPVEEVRKSIFQLQTVSSVSSKSTTPLDELELVDAESGVLLLGQFEPGSVVRLGLSRPLFEQEHTFQVEFPRTKSVLQFVDVDPVLGLFEGRAINLRHLGVERVQAKLFPVWQNASHGRLIEFSTGRQSTSELRSGAFAPIEPNLYWLRIQDSTRPWLSDQRLAGRFGLSAILHHRRGYLHAMVRSAEGPAAGALVQVLDRSGAVVAKGYCSRSGTVQLRWRGSNPEVFLAQDGKEFVAFPTEPTFWPGTGVGKDLSLLNDVTSAARCLAVPSPAVVDPGQEIDVSIACMDGRGSGYSAEMQVNLHRRIGTILASVPASVLSTGVGHVSIRVPNEILAGNYMIDLRENDIVHSRLSIRVNGDSLRLRATEDPLSFVVDGLQEDSAEAGCDYHLISKFANLPQVAAQSEPRFRTKLIKTQPLICPPPPPASRPWSVTAFVASDAGDAELEVKYADREQYLDYIPPDGPVEPGTSVGGRIVGADRRGKPLDGNVQLQVRPSSMSKGLRLKSGHIRPYPKVVAGEPQKVSLTLESGQADFDFVPPQAGGWQIELPIQGEKEVWVGTEETRARPATLRLYRDPGGVRATVPFPGTLFVATHGAEVTELSHLDAMTVMNRVVLSNPQASISATLVGSEGLVAVGQLPKQKEERSDVSILVDTALVPGRPIPVTVRVNGPSWGGLFRLIALDAEAAIETAGLERIVSSVPELKLRTSLSSSQEIPRTSQDRTGPVRLRSSPGRPARGFVASPWLPLSKSGVGFHRLPWGPFGGRIRVIAQVRAAGKFRLTSVERIAGDGIGVAWRVPTEVRAKDRPTVPIRVRNEGVREMVVSVAADESGFRPVQGVLSTSLAPGATTEMYWSVEAEPTGDLVARVGESVLRAEVSRLEEEPNPTFGIAASARSRNPAILPELTQLGALKATVVVGKERIVRFVSALAGRITEHILTSEEAAAALWAASTQSSLVDELGLKLSIPTSILQAGLRAKDPWLRGFSALAIAEARGRISAFTARPSSVCDFGCPTVNGLVEEAWNVLKDLVRPQVESPTSVTDDETNAAELARFVLSRHRKSFAPRSKALGPPTRLDAVFFAAASDVLAGRVSKRVLRDLAVAPAVGGSGRYSPTLLNALSLWALESTVAGGKMSELLESSVISSARRGRWSFAAEEAASLAAISASSAREITRPYWGSLSVGRAVVGKFNSRRTFVHAFDPLAGQPALSVTGAGEAQVGLWFAADRRVSQSQLQLATEGPSESLGEGETSAYQLSVKGPPGLSVLMHLPLPAGLQALEVGEALRIRGGLSWSAKLDENGQFEASAVVRARFPGVWFAPGAEVRPAYGGSGVQTPEQAVRVQPRSPDL